VIDSELKNQIVITPEDIAAYYEKNVKAQKTDTDSAMEMEDINEMIIKHLRQEKTEEAYKKWIKKTFLKIQKYSRSFLCGPGKKRCSWASSLKEN